MAAAWALVWAPLFTLFGIVYGVAKAFDVHRSDPLLVAPVLGFVVGLITGWFYGIAFGGVLWLIERGRSPASLSTWRVAVWGAIPGLLIATLLYWSATATVIFGLLGAGTASVMLRLTLRETNSAARGASNSPGPSA
jgi:hypothetical protein